MQVHETKLSDILDISTLQEILDKFSLATGLGAVLADTHGEPISNYSYFTSFCSTIRAHPEGKRRCRMSDAFLGQKALSSGSVEVHYCHAGLIDIAAPIIVNGVHVATVLCGQVLSDDADRPEGDANYEKCACDLGIDRDMLEKCRSEIHVLPRVKINAAADLLHIISNYIVGMSINYMNELLITDINLKMAEEKNARLDLERVLRITELKSLQAQVNPHFLFNALNTIARLAMLENAPKTEEISFALADLLRHNLRKSGQFVTVREEENHIKKYLQIQEVRFSDRFRSEIYVDESIKDMRLPVMTLQPLVENAIDHGLADISENGIIKVRGYLDGNIMKLIVSDNGVGMDSARKESVMAELRSDADLGQITGIGIKNVYKQLRFYFGEAFGFDIVSAPGCGTEIHIEIDQKAGLAKETIRL